LKHSVSISHCHVRLHSLALTQDTANPQQLQATLRLCLPVTFFGILA